jgi:hypothetical protein
MRGRGWRREIAGISRISDPVRVASDPDQITACPFGQTYHSLVFCVFA